MPAVSLQDFFWNWFVIASFKDWEKVTSSRSHSWLWPKAGLELTLSRFLAWYLNHYIKQALSTPIYRKKNILTRSITIRLLSLHAFKVGMVTPVASAKVQRFQEIKLRTRLLKDNILICLCLDICTFKNLLQVNIKMISPSSQIRLTYLCSFLAFFHFTSRSWLARIFAECGQKTQDSSNASAIEHGLVSVCSLCTWKPETVFIILSWLSF